jgi:uncharacterized protein
VIAPDVNVLLYALRADAERHEEYAAWLDSARRSGPLLVLFEPVLSGVLRIATHPKIYAKPSKRSVVQSFLSVLLASPNVRAGRAQTGHWSRFLALCQAADCRGNLVQDAYLAALAMEAGCQWITTDRDFARFPGLEWRHPLPT